MTTASRSKEAGFSLIELMVAITITVIITGAMFGLLTGGQTAFKREPERTDLQQNLRIGMNIVMEDVAMAGMGLDPYQQVFTTGLDESTTVSGANTADALEILGLDGTCNGLVATGDGASTITLKQALPPCFYANSTAIVIVSRVGGVHQWALATGLARGATTITLAGTQPAGVVAPTAPTDTNAVQLAKLVRYQIATPAAPDNIPSLYRSEVGGLSAGGVLQAPLSGAGGWQAVARGIENFQVQYRTDAIATWQDGAPAVTAATVNTIIKEVRVTLFGRGIKTGLQGQMAGPTGAPTLRAQLVSIGTPRAALFGILTQPVAGGGAAKWTAGFPRIGWRS